MRKRYKILVIIIGVIVLFPFLYSRVQIILLKRGIDGGWCSGRYVEVNLKDLKIEKRFPFSDGEFLFSNLEDELPPIMIRLNHNKEIVWAVQFEMEKDCINMNSITELKYDESYNRIEFFNSNYGEPGVIQLTFDYEIASVYTSYM